MMRVYTSIIFQNDQPSIGLRDCHKCTRDWDSQEGWSARGKRVQKHK